MGIQIEHFDIFVHNGRTDEYLAHMFGYNIRRGKYLKSPASKNVCLFICNAKDNYINHII